MKLAKDKVRVALALVLVIGFTGVAHTVRSSHSSAVDYPTAAITASSPEVVIDIPAGATGSEVGALLAGAEVIASAESYFRVAVGDPRSARVAPGSHRLTLKISAKQALDQLLDSKRNEGLIAVAEGMWNSEIVALIASLGYSKDSIQQALSKVPLPKGFRSSEGLLFPAHYSFEKNTPVESIIKTMVDRGIKEINAAGLFASKEKFSPHELLIIASLCQQEGNTEDFAKISRVIRNRLTIGMPLQFDSTVHYIKKSRGSVFLSTSSTLLNNPYNTYRKYGLPPGPIGNPGAAALSAAVKPAAGDWLYFITVAPGDTRYTKSSSEFLSWKAVYKKNLAAGMFDN